MDNDTTSALDEALAILGSALDAYAAGRRLAAADALLGHRLAAVAAEDWTRKTNVYKAIDAVLLAVDKTDPAHDRIAEYVTKTQRAANAECLRVESAAVAARNVRDLISRPKLF